MNTAKVVVITQSRGVFCS